MTLPHSEHKHVKSSDGGGQRFVQVDAVMLSTGVYDEVCALVDAKAGEKTASVRAFIARATEYALLSLAREQAARGGAYIDRATELAYERLEKPPLGVSGR